MYTKILKTKVKKKTKKKPRFYFLKKTLNYSLSRELTNTCIREHLLLNFNADKMKYIVLRVDHNI